MLLVIAVLVVILFGGLGFAAHVLWLGLILGLILAIVHSMQRSGTGARR